MIRNLQTKDIDAVMNIWLSVNIQAHNFIDSSYWNENFDMVQEILPKTLVFVYEQDEQIFGFIGLNDTYIEGIFVDNAKQSSGVGRKLIEYVKDKNNQLSLRVYKKNKRAVEFYLREGFTVVNEEEDVNTGEKEWVMVWKK